MPILTRRIGEAIHIGDDIQLRVLDVKRHQVRLGVSAPTTTAVHRGEIYRRIQAQQGEGSGVEHRRKKGRSG